MYSDGPASHEKGSPRVLTVIDVGGGGGCGLRRRGAEPPPWAAGEPTGRRACEDVSQAAA
jgi:hypothetical protein